MKNQMTYLVIVVAAIAAVLSLKAYLDSRLEKTRLAVEAQVRVALAKEETRRYEIIQNILRDANP